MRRVAYLALAAVISGCTSETLVLERPLEDAGVSADARARDAAPELPDAEPIIPDAGPPLDTGVTCETGPIVLHTTAGDLEGLSLAANGGRWAMTYAHIPADGSGETTYLILLEAGGRAAAAARAVEPYARVVAYRDGFLLVGPNLETPLFAVLDRDGNELVRAMIAPPALGSGVIGRLRSSGDTITGVAHDALGDHVFTIRGEAPLIIQHEVDLPPADAHSFAFGLTPDRVLRATTPRVWNEPSNVLALERDSGGRWSEKFRDDLWTDAPDEVEDALWVDGEWWILGTRYVPSDWETVTVARLTADGTALPNAEPAMRPSDARPPGHYVGYPIGTIELAGERPGILFSTGNNQTTVGAMLAGFASDGSALERSELAFRNDDFSDRLLLAWNTDAARYGALGIDPDAGLVFRCDLRDDGSSADYAPPIVPPPADQLPSTPPINAGACGPDAPIVPIDREQGVRLLDFAAAGDAFAVLIEYELVIIDRAGVERRRVPWGSAVVELDGAFLLASSDRLALIDPSGLTLAEASITTVIHSTRAFLAGLAARENRGAIAVGGELFAIDWNRSNATLDVGTSTRCPELGLIGLEPDRALFATLDEYALQNDGTWSRRSLPSTSRFRWVESAAWSAGEQRWWTAGTIEVPGTPYVRSAIERFDPLTGTGTLDFLDVPTTRRLGISLLIEPTFPASTREAFLAGGRFFATSPLAGRPTFGATPWTTMIAPERELGSYAYATEVRSPVSTRGWIEIRCGLR